MAHAIVFMFSGQGSQYYHMGKSLYDHHDRFRAWMTRLDAHATELVGESVCGKIYSRGHGMSDSFERTLYSHPAIFMVEYALAQVLIDDGIEPDVVLGASLGEFSSAAVAGILGVEDALRLVVDQARVIEEYCRPGAMLAVMANESLYHDTPTLFKNSELASVNFADHFVVSQQSDRIQTVEKYLKDQGINHQKLPVTQAFHSALMDPAEAAYKEKLTRYSLRKPAVRFASCTTGRILPALPDGYLWDIVRKPIRFQKIIQTMEGAGGFYFFDLGPSGTLDTFLKYNLSGKTRSKSFPLITLFGDEINNLQNIKRLFSIKRSGRSSRKEKNMRTFVFPGQGSQKRGMGEGLFDEYRDLTETADHILGYSIEELCLADPCERLNRTQYTQPALYVVNALSYLKHIGQTGQKPDYLAGHSLGEYCALFAAGVFDFETGLRLVEERGRLMSRATGGAMAAIVGMDESQVRRVIESNDLKNISIANYNSPSQLVIAGPEEDIQWAKALFEDSGARLYIILNVSGAFHTRHMMPATADFESFIGGFDFSDAAIPVLSNVTARPHEPGEFKKNLVSQITSPVQWTDSIRYLMGVGEMSFEEIGPGNVLKNLVKKIQAEAKPVMGPAGAQCSEAGADSSGTTPGREKNTPANFFNLSAQALGNDEFKRDYNVKYAYVTGAMYRGIASKELVVKMGKAGMIGFFGTGSLKIDQIESAIREIQQELGNGHAYGMNLLHNPNNPEMENKTVDLYLQYHIRNVEAAAYIQVTAALVRYRLRGLERQDDGTVRCLNRVMAKVSRPEVAHVFLSPAPSRIVEKLLNEQAITPEQAELSKQVPMADDICVEADSGGHTDGGVAYALVPAIMRLRDEMAGAFEYRKKIRVGAAGGIGSPEAASAAFILGADFILTGSINQCTVEAGTSDRVKDLLQEMNVQDTAYAPAGDMFEMGAKIQVLRKGVFFPARANKLYDPALSR